MTNLNDAMQYLFNTVTKTGSVNDSYLKRITRFDALFTDFEDSDNGFKLTSNDGTTFNVSKYQLLGLVLENPLKLDSIAIRKGGVDNTMLSYSTNDNKQAKVDDSPLSLLINIIKQYNKDEIAVLQAEQQAAMQNINHILASIAHDGTLKINNDVIDVSSVVSLLNVEKYAEQLNKFTTCFNPAKSTLECTSTGNSKGLQVTLFDAEIVDNKIQALYKTTDDDSKPIINTRLIDLGFTGIKWSGKTSLSVDLS